MIVAATACVLPGTGLNVPPPTVFAGDETSYIFRHHIKRVRRALSYYDKDYDWRSDPDQTVVDYIASMSDGYFMELTEHLFPELSFPRRTYIR